MVKTGLELFLTAPQRWVGAARVGLVANPTAVDGQLRHAIDLFSAHPEIDLRLLFGPEHGIRGAAQDMESVETAVDPTTGLPTISLYGTTEASLAPTADQLAALDCLVFDIQDIGARYYTYAATMALCLKAAGRAGKKVVVLDRPNPLNGATVEGGGIREGLTSFVGLYSVPQRHGMTLGELARLYCTAFGIRCDVEVVPCHGWRREQFFDQTGLPWVMPSPNMPTLDTALVYPGLCLLEGTNISEGRGTTRPFEIFGAPFVDGLKLAATLAEQQLPGVRFRPLHFIPTFHKFAGVTCGGLQLHVIDRQAFRPVATGLAILWALRQLWPEAFCWRQQPYEFRSDVLAIDLLIGQPEVRQAIDGGAPWKTVLARATEPPPTYWAGRDDALLY